MLVKQGERRYSLASHFEYFSQDGAFGRAIAANAPEVDQSRLILQKQTGKRDLEDIHVVTLIHADITRPFLLIILKHSSSYYLHHQNFSISFPIWMHVSLVKKLFFYLSIY
jgi:hypothetical protein